jgi:hypothetical protein
VEKEPRPKGGLYHLKEPLIIINQSLLRSIESSDIKSFWIPAFAGMTFLEVALILNPKIEIPKQVRDDKKAKTKRSRHAELVSASGLFLSAFKSFSRSFSSYC